MDKINLQFQTVELLSCDEKRQLMELWNSEYPAKLVYTDLTEFEKYLHLLEKPTHNLVWLNERIVGWATKFYRDQSKWFAIILSSSIQGQNIGSRLMEQIKANESLLYGWVIDHDEDIKADGKRYISPLNFYLKQDFKITEDERLELTTLSAVKIFWSNNYKQINSRNEY